MAKPVCRKCNSAARVYIRRIINAAGVSMYAWRCLSCDIWAQSPIGYIGHDEMRSLAAKAGKPLDAVPVVDDYRQKCAICGHPGAEYNHWMPQMFKEHPEVAPQWSAWDQAGAPLCKRHHDLWHDLVTPWMSGRGSSRR